MLHAQTSRNSYFGGQGREQCNGRNEAVGAQPAAVPRPARLAHRLHAFFEPTSAPALSSGLTGEPPARSERRWPPTEIKRGICTMTTASDSPNANQ